MPKPSTQILTLAAIGARQQLTEWTAELEGYRACAADTQRLIDRLLVMFPALAQTPIPPPLVGPPTGPNGATPPSPKGNRKPRTKAERAASRRAAKAYWRKVKAEQNS